MRHVECSYRPHTTWDVYRVRTKTAVKSTPWESLHNSQNTIIQKCALQTFGSKMHVVSFAFLHMYLYILVPDLDSIFVGASPSMSISLWCFI